MPTSYDGTLLEHLADHIMYLSTASSFWFSLNSSYDHGCHLSKQMGMSPQDYEYLLVAANLAHFHQKRGFSIKILMWKLFLEGHLFATTYCTDTVVVEAKKLDLDAYVNGVSPKNRQQLYFIQIGVLAVDSPRKIEMQRYSDGRMKTTPPRLNGLHFRRRTFRELMDPFVWNYVLNNGLEEVKKVEDGVSSDDDESSVLPPPPPSVDITPVKTSATTVDDSSKYLHLP